MKIPDHLVIDCVHIYRALTILEQAGMVAKHIVTDGEREVLSDPTVKSVVEKVFGQDDSLVGFGQGQWIVFILGNGKDVVSDCSSAVDAVLEREGYYEWVPDEKYISHVKGIMTGHPYGLDWSVGLGSNIDTETGIRYGVIGVNSLDLDHFNPEAIYPEQENDEDDDDYQERIEFSDPIDWDYTADDPEVDTEYSESLNAITVIKSPYCTIGKFCSPCVPGGIDLDEAPSLEEYLEGINGELPDYYFFRDMPRAYCLGHDYWDEGAPYPVFSVKTGELVKYVSPEQKKLEALQKYRSPGDGWILSSWSSEKNQALWRSINSDDKNGFDWLLCNQDGSRINSAYGWWLEIPEEMKLEER